MSATNDAILLRINKQDQVRALQDLGFTNVTNNTPLSEIAEYIRWAGGLRDLRIACVKISEEKRSLPMAAEQRNSGVSVFWGKRICIKKFTLK